MKALKRLKEMSGKQTLFGGDVSPCEDFKIRDGKGLVISDVYGTMDNVRYIATCINSFTALIELVEAMDDARFFEWPDIWDKGLPLCEKEYIQARERIKQARAKLESLEV